MLKTYEDIEEIVTLSQIMSNLSSMKLAQGLNYNTKSEKDSLYNPNMQSSMSLKDLDKNSKGLLESPCRKSDCLNNSEANMSIPSDSSSGNFENDEEFSEQNMSSSTKQNMNIHAFSMQNLIEPSSKIKIS